MFVYGKFMPTATGYYGCTLQDGAALDLTEWRGGFPMTSDFVDGNRTLKFAAGAAIAVNLEGRTDLKSLARSANPYLVTWESEPTATFTLDGATSREGFKIFKEATGLRIQYTKGMMLIVR